MGLKLNNIFSILRHIIFITLETVNLPIVDHTKLLRTNRHDHCIMSDKLRYLHTLLRLELTPALYLFRHADRTHTVQFTIDLFRILSHFIRNVNQFIQIRPYAQ